MTVVEAAERLRAAIERAEKCDRVATEARAKAKEASAVYDDAAADIRVAERALLDAARSAP